MLSSKLGTVLGAALLGWAMSAAAMNLGLATTPLAEALVIHALAAPILFIFVSVYYFQRFAYTTPLTTAIIFVCVALFMDFAVGLLFHGGLGMFASLLGTWIPLFLICAATHITGLLVMSGRRYNVPAR